MCEKSCFYCDNRKEFTCLGDNEPRSLKDFLRRHKGKVKLEDLNDYGHVCMSFKRKPWSVS